MVIEYACLPFAKIRVSLAVRVKLSVPASPAPGVPLIRAFVLLRPLKVRFKLPSDPLVTLHVQQVGDARGVSLAVKLWLYATPTSPFGRGGCGPTVIVV